MSTKRSIGRAASTQQKVRPAVKSKKARSTNLCTFTFADGRQCRTPRCSGHLHLCYFHAQKEAESLAAQQVGQDISRFLPAKLLTACDLGVAMSRLFCAVAQGQIKPKVASTLAYLAQTMLQSIPIARHEYCEALGTDYWCGAIRSSFKVPPPEPSPAPQPQPVKSMPAPTPKPTTQPPRPTAQPAPESSAQAAPSPHSPLPRTGTEFAQQVMAGPSSSRSAPPTPSAPSREPVSSASSPAAPCASTPLPVCHPARSEGSQPIRSTQPSSVANRTCHEDLLAAEPAARPEEPASSSNSSLATHHSPLPHNPPPVPPGFGAPANWDVLIPLKPRRRFSRHWHLLE